MSRSKKEWVRWSGIGLGAILLLGGVAAVAFLEWNPLPPPPPEAIRPVKAATVIRFGAVPERRFPGVVQAGRTVDLSFQVSGPLLETDWSLGEEVEAGQVLMRVDPVRFEQQIATLEPQVEVAGVRYQRLKELEEAGVANPLELAEAKTAFEAAQAQLSIARQALADSQLKAPFAALLVQRFANDFENIQAGRPVIRLQDISTVDIAVDLPDTVAARRRPATGRLEVSFSVLPGQRFPVTVKEASAEADAETGTYRAVFTMPRLEDTNLLPGMVASLHVPPFEGEEEAALIVPAPAVWIDDQGRSRVWVVESAPRDFVIRSVVVEVDGFAADQAVISGGLEPGVQVVTAGVAFLREEQRVTITEDSR